MKSAPHPHSGRTQADHSTVSEQAQADPSGTPNEGEIERPLLLVDVDGVISLFGFDPSDPPAGAWQMVDGIAHLLSATAGAHLRRLSGAFDLAWCTGWEEKANEYLPRALGLERRFPHLSFARAIPLLGGHWKLEAIDRYAGADRPVAWIDDSHEERCRAWAERRPGPTLLITTDPATGLTEDHVGRLLEWASALDGDHREHGREPQRERPPGGTGVA